MAFGPVVHCGPVLAREWIASVPLSLKEAVPMLIQALTLAHMGYMELTLFERVL